MSRKSTRLTQMLLAFYADVAALRACVTAAVRRIKPDIAVLARIFAGKEERPFQ